MPLETPYVVIVGALLDSNLVNPDSGQWPHYHVRLIANNQVMDSAINLKSLTEVKIEYRRRQFPLDDARFANIVALGDGVHPLAQTSASGALDYVRHNGLTGTTGWTLQSGDNLIAELNALLGGVVRIYIFGAAYSTGVGVHDVHMNQGDPDESPFQHLDGIWQDGGILFQYGGLQHRLEMLQIKFETQSLYTDDQGHPILLRRPKNYYEYIPRWRWPPGDPMKSRERQILVENGLFQLAAWAALIGESSPEVNEALSRELHSELTRRLEGASPDHITRVAGYIVEMGRQFRTSGR